MLERSINGTVEEADVQADAGVTLTVAPKAVRAQTARGAEPVIKRSGLEAKCSPGWPGRRARWMP